MLMHGVDMRKLSGAFLRAELTVIPADSKLHFAKPTFTGNFGSLVFPVLRFGFRETLL